MANERTGTHNGIRCDDYTAEVPGIDYRLPYREFPSMHRWLRIVDESTSRHTHLLCVTCEGELLMYCMAVLRRAGYQVTVASTGAQAVSILNRMSVDLLIIGNTMTVEERTDLAFSVKSNAPETLLLVLSARGQPIEPLADTFVACVEDGEYLLRVIIDLLDTRKPRRIR